MGFKEILITNGGKKLLDEIIKSIDVNKDRDKDKVKDKTDGLA
jgi:hypothetical protein